MAMPEASLWRVEVTLPEIAVEAASRCLSAFCVTVSSFVANEREQMWQISGLCAKAPPPAQLAAARMALEAGFELSELTFTVSPVVQRDWLSHSLDELPALRIGRFFLHGSHHQQPVPPGSWALKVDAATAFGSGRHPTTQGCLLALEQLTREIQPTRLLDLGCGSGVLAMAMARAWRCARVLAVDNDPEAVRVARRNARDNRLGGQISVACSWGYAWRPVLVASPFQVVAANILMRPLMALARPASHHVAAGGILVLSGFYREDGGRVLAAHRSQGFRLHRTLDVEDWRTLVLRRA